jgi:hypothetical protein
VVADDVRLHDANTAGVGDWIVTRANMRLLRLNGGRNFAKSGDIRTVTSGRPGRLVHRTALDHGAEIRLPATYVERDVKLSYIVTGHRAQGMTVHTTYALATDDTTRVLNLACRSSVLGAASGQLSWTFPAEPVTLR